MKQTPEKHKRLLFYILINSLVHKSSSLNMEKVYSSCNVIFNTSWLTDRVLFDQTSHVMKLHVFTEPSSCLSPLRFTLSHAHDLSPPRFTLSHVHAYQHHASHWVSRCMGPSLTLKSAVQPFTSSVVHVTLFLHQLYLLCLCFIRCLCYNFTSSSAVPVMPFSTRIGGFKSMLSVR